MYVVLLQVTQCGSKYEWKMKQNNNLQHMLMHKYMIVEMSEKKSRRFIL